MIYHGRIHLYGQKEFPCQFWADGFVPLVKFGIRYIVQQGTETYNLNVHFFILRDQQGIVEHPLDMEPIMTSFRPLQCFLYKGNCLFHLLYIVHVKISILKRIKNQDWEL